MSSSAESSCSSFLKCFGAGVLRLTINELLQLEAKLMNGDPTIGEDLAALLDNFKRYKSEDRAKIVNFIKIAMKNNLEVGRSGEAN